MANGEAEVVSGEELSKILKRWTDDWLKKRNPDYERYVVNSPQVMTPWDWLEQETGINERRIRGFIKGEFKFVPLSQADAVLQATGHEGWLTNGIHVIPNPNWSTVNWIEYMSNRGCI